MIYIATPTYGGNVDIRYHTSMMSLLATCLNNNIPICYPELSQESLVTRARNSLLHDFLCSPATHVAWIDSDIGFKPADLLRLVRSGFPFVCGAYPKKGLKLEELKKWVIENPDRPIQEFHNYAYNPLPGSTAEVLDRGDGGLYMPVRHASNGFMVWTRETALKLVELSSKHPYMGTSFEGTGCAQYRVFHTDSTDDMQYLSEDYWVSDLWTGSGGKVMMDLNIKLTHSGRFTWEGDLSSQFKSCT